MANRLSTWIHRYLMHHYARINVGHLFIGPCKDVMKFAKKVGIKLNLLRSTSDSNVKMFDNPWFHRDVDGLGLHNVSHISFRGHLINLDRCLKDLKWEIRRKPLETSKHILRGREK